MKNGNKNFENAVKGSFERILRSAIEKENIVDAHDVIDKEYKKLYSCFLDNKIICDHFNEIDLYIYLLDFLFGCRELFNLPSSEKESFLDSGVRESANKFLSFLHGLPYWHDVYFQVGFELPDEINEVAITENIGLVRVVDPQLLGFDAPSGSLGDLFVREGKLLSGETYVVCKANGYTRENFSGSATKHAYRLLKRFIYLGLAKGVFKDTRWSSPRIQNPKSFFIRHGLSEKPFSLDLPLSVKPTLEKLSWVEWLFEIDPKELAEDEERRKAASARKPVAPFGFPAMNTASSFLFKPPAKKGDPAYAEECVGRFFSKLYPIRDFLSAKCPAQIEVAMDWGFEGLINPSDENGLIQTCIGLEAILGDEEMGRNSEDRLADRCAYLIGGNRKDREKLIIEFKEIYKLRSKIVHGKHIEIPKDKSSLLDRAQHILRQCVWHELNEVRK